MKILLLNPHIDAGHKIVSALQATGAGVLLATNADEGWQMLQLHGKSVDLAVIHREGIEGLEEGLGFVKKIKADPAQADLPFIISSAQWGDTEFASHQNTPDGANAYLPWPFDEGQLIQLITSLFGEALSSGTQTGFSASGVLMPPPPPVPRVEGSGPVQLEEASSIFNQPQAPAESSEGEFVISLQAPEVTAAVQEPSGSFATVALPADEAKMDDPVLEITQSQLIEMPPAEEFSLAPIGEEPPSAEVPSVEAPIDDQELASEMPYLFSSKKSEAQGPGAEAPNPALVFAQPVGDAVVPGGAAQAPDIETLKKYLLLREQDVAVLSTQLNAAQEQVRALENQLKSERGQNTELTRTIDDQKRKIEEFEREKAIATGNLQAEIDDLRFQVKAKTDKARVLDSQVREAAQEIERLKERVRSDIRKIRVREKELENRLEIVKKDSEALIAARENKIIELKRKIDILEFNMDLLQDQYSREKEISAKLRERLAKAAQVVRVAGGLLDASALAANIAGGGAAKSDGSDPPESGEKAS